MSGGQAIAVKEEFHEPQEHGGGDASNNVENNISSMVLNEVRPIYQSNIPGYERDTIADMHLAELGLPTDFCQGLCFHQCCYGQAINMKGIAQQIYCANILTKIISQV